MIDRKLSQIRKEATVAVSSCAGVWLAGFIFSPQSIFQFIMTITHFPNLILDRAFLIQIGLL